MLTIDLSLSGCIKLMEKSFILPAKSIGKTMQGVFFSSASAKEVSAVSTLDTAKPEMLRIAKTTLPDRRLNFNDTFRHIRCELDMIYKAQNPIFDNSADAEVSELWLSKSSEGKSRQKNDKAFFSIVGTLAGPSEKTITTLEGSKTPALWISKTVMPKDRMDFNDTFRNVRFELDEFYKKRNPNFTNAIKPVVRRNEDTATGNQYSASLSLPRLSIASDRRAVKKDAQAAKGWLSVSAKAAC